MLQSDSRGVMRRMACSTLAKQDLGQQRGCTSLFLHRDTDVVRVSQAHYVRTVELQFFGPGGFETITT